MIEVAGRSRPPVVEILEVLHAKTRRALLGRRHAALQVLEREILEPHFTGAADVERDRSERSGLGIDGQSAEARRSVHAGAEDVGVDQHLERIPVVRLECGRGGRGGNIDTNVEAGPAPRPPPGAPPARPPLGGGGGGWIRSIAPPERVKRLTIADAPLRVDGYRGWRRRSTGQRRVNAFDPRRALLAPHHDACRAVRGTPIGTGELHVLVTGIDEEPAAISALRRADDLAVLGAPRRLADLIGPGQRGSFERPVWNERGGHSRRRCLRAGVMDNTTAISETETARLRR